MSPPSIRVSWRPVRVLVLFMLVFAGCVSGDKAVSGARTDLLEFLQDGTTTRTEALLRLGQPTAVLEQENLITFRIGEDVNKGYFVVGPGSTTGWAWERARYSLVLVFDKDGVLTDHSLVLVR